MIALDYGRVDYERARLLCHARVPKPHRHMPRPASSELFLRGHEGKEVKGKRKKDRRPTTTTTTTHSEIFLPDGRLCIVTRCDSDQCHVPSWPKERLNEGSAPLIGCTQRRMCIPPRLRRPRRAGASLAALRARSLPRFWPPVKLVAIMTSTTTKMAATAAARRRRWHHLGRTADRQSRARWRLRC